MSLSIIHSIVTLLCFVYGFSKAELALGHLGPSLISGRGENRGDSCLRPPSFFSKILYFTKVGPRKHCRTKGG